MFQHSIPEMRGKLWVFAEFKSDMQKYDLLKRVLSHCILQISSALQMLCS